MWHYITMLRNIPYEEFRTKILRHASAFPYHQNIKFAGVLAEQIYKIRSLMQLWNFCDDVEPVSCGPVMLVTGQQHILPLRLDSQVVT
jgi:hypothetical protein